MYKIILSILIIIVIIIFFVYLTWSINPLINFVSKSDLLDYIKDFSMDYIVVDKNKNKDKDKLINLNYPLIFKPNNCSGFAYNVKLINNYQEALDYFNNSIDNSIIIQKYHNGPHEFTVFYKRNPINNKINIIVVERVMKNSSLLWKSTTAYKHGDYSIHRPELETKILKKKIEYISYKIPEFYFGRYDIRCKSYNNLKNGNFKILEVAGHDSMDTRFDIKHKINYNLQIISAWVYIRYKYGLLNIIKGNGCNIVFFIQNYIKYLIRYKKCESTTKLKNIFINFF